MPPTQNPCPLYPMRTTLSKFIELLILGSAPPKGEGGGVVGVSLGGSVGKGGEEGRSILDKGIGVQACVISLKISLIHLLLLFLVKLREPHVVRFPDRINSLY